MDNTVLFDKITEQEIEIMKLDASNRQLCERVFKLAREAMNAKREKEKAIQDAVYAREMAAYYRDKLEKLEWENRIKKMSASVEFRRI